MTCCCYDSTELPLRPAVFNCSFEDDFCNMTQDKTDSPDRDTGYRGDFDWTRISGSTSTASTGPSSGQGGSAFYIYAEASGPQQSRDEAR